MSKVCSCCNVEQPVSNFYKHKGKPQSQCKGCLKVKRKAYYDENKDLVRNRVAASNYGITLEEVVALKGRGECDICGSDGSEYKLGLHIDHCHETKKVRGLLCHGCNTGLGAFKENSTSLRAAMEYLTWAEEQQ